MSMWLAVLISLTYAFHSDIETYVKESITDLKEIKRQFILNEIKYKLYKKKRKKR